MLSNGAYQIMVKWKVQYHSKQNLKSARLFDLSRLYLSLGTCQKLAGVRGVEIEGGSQLFETQKREGS